jgi:glucosamine-6-phosphate isomerase
MNIHIAADFNQMSVSAAVELLQRLEGIPAPVVILPSGKSPVGLLSALRTHFEQRGQRPAWHFVGLDEWVGVGQDVFGSCREFLDRHLFKPLGIPEAQIHFFNGLAPDLDAERRKAEDTIAALGGIDVAVLGVGTNGHLGLNEPGSDPSRTTQVSVLATSTVDAAKDYFNTERTVTHGITLGLKTLLDARTIYLLASGSGKADIIRRVVEGPVSPEVPGAYLQQHPDCHLFLDTNAAAALTS